MRKARHIGLGNHHDIIDVVRTTLTSGEVEKHMEAYFSDERLIANYISFPQYLERIDNTTRHLRKFNPRDVREMVLYPI